MRHLYSFLADFIVTVHLLYVIFAVGGQVLILLGAALRIKLMRNSQFRIAHLAAVGLVALEAAAGMLCPLTIWEYDMRQIAGETVERDLPFMARLARLVLFYDFPPWVFTVAHISFGILVVLTFLLVPPEFRRRK